MTDTLAKVIATVESGPFQYAVRFESGMFAGKVGPLSAAETACMKANRCSSITARMICCTSWGLFQIMGFNLYGPLALQIPVGSFMFDTETQFDTFRKFVTLNGFDPENFDCTDEALIERFARSYNGPGDVANYAAKMKAAFASL
jgi:hypothetical protein